MRKNGTFCVRVSNGRKNGKQVLISATYHPLPGATAAQTQKGLKEFAALLEAAVHSGQYHPGVDVQKCLCEDLTVAEYAPRYLEKIKNRMSPNTVPMYKSVINDIIIESFGSVRLKDVSSRHLQALIDFLAGEGSRVDATNSEPLNPATIKRYATVFSSLMESAFEDGYAEKDAWRDRPVHYPRVDPRITVPYDEEEIKHFLQALDKEDLRTQAYYYIAIFCGMRRSEILGLTWDDIDFDRRTIYVHKAYFKPKGSPATTKPPKSSASVRLIPIPQKVISVLVAWKKRQAFHMLGNSQGHVFTTDKGFIWNEDEASRHIYRIEEKACLRRLNLHGLRHTFSSLLAKNNASIVDIRELMGHSEQKTTLGYCHSYADNRSGIAIVRILDIDFGNFSFGFSP